MNLHVPLYGQEHFLENSAIVKSVFTSFYRKSSTLHRHPARCPRITNENQYHLCVVYPLYDGFSILSIICHQA